MKKTNFILICIFATLSLALAPLASAKMEITLVDISGSPLPPGDPAQLCLGPDVYVVSGQLKIMTRVSDDRNGGFHLSHHEQLINVVMMDAISGTYYRAAGNPNLAIPPNLNSYHITSGGSVIIHQGINVVIVPIGDPDSPSFRVNSLYKMTVNANGDVSAEVENVSFSCS